MKDISNIKIEEWESKALAAQVVVYRTLKINKELSMACMSELLRRELDGDDFDYQTFITDELAKMPKRPEKQDMNGILGGIMKGVEGLRETVNRKNGQSK